MTYQYYYKDNTCKAHSARDSDCICWHDEGTGPMGDVNRINGEVYLSWRIKEGTLKPCPFCGSRDIGIHERDLTGTYDSSIVIEYSPGCNTEECMGEWGVVTFKTYEDAKNAWNRRLL